MTDGDWALRNVAFLWFLRGECIGLMLGILEGAPGADAAPSVGQVMQETPRGPLRAAREQCAGAINSHEER